MTSKRPGSPVVAKQGHRYQLNGKSVLALESGTRVRLLCFNSAAPWRDYIVEADAIELIPEPMVYHSNQLP